MPDARYTFTPPASAALRWLTEPGQKVSPWIAATLLGEIFASPGAVIVGVVNGLVLNSVALFMHRGGIFALFIVIDLILAGARIAVVRSAVAMASRNRPTPTDLYLLTASGWCALQGAMAFAAMRTNILPLQILAATTVMGLIGPICARNYAAPRYALLLVGLCDVPFVAGAALSGNPWLLILVLQTPLFLFGVVTIIKRFQRMAIANLRAERDSHHHARHDTLTGLLNRFGLMEQLDIQYAAGGAPFILFYLDLDGFKPINDRFGHQAGDAVLRAVAHRLRSSVRGEDVVARLGGDEFVIVAPEMSPFEGARYADGLIRSVTEQPYGLDDAEAVKIGLSVGFACSPDDGSTGDDLHRKADAALYEAKGAGKGVYRRFSAPPSVAKEVRYAATPARLDETCSRLAG